MLTLGKQRGMATISSANGTLSMLALDHRGSFKKMTAAMFDGAATWQQVVDEKVRLAKALAPHASAVLVDPVYAAAPLVAQGTISGATGLLVTLEKSGYVGEDSARRNVIEPGWSVAAIKKMGAAGLKFLVHYHPDARNAAEQVATMREVGDACREHDLVLVAEPVGYNPTGGRDDPGYIAGMTELVVQTAKDFSTCHADVLKLEYPLLEDKSFEDMQAACQAVTDATPLPWVVLSGGVAFEDFLEQVRAACAGGASGFLGGRAIWKEAMSMADPAARDAYLAQTAAPRISALKDVTEAAATPWTERPYAQSAYVPTEGWQLSYASG
ncbi:MAG: tagatose 1,6-diphosphate aldolase [Pseudomonadota bacterium]